MTILKLLKSSFTPEADAFETTGKEEEEEEILNEILLIRESLEKTLPEIKIAKNLFSF